MTGWPLKAERKEAAGEFEVTDRVGEGGGKR